MCEKRLAMRRTRAMGLVALLVLLTAGCATLHPDYETPTVTVGAVRALPSEGLAPRFEIDLHIINPNRSALALQGIAYTLKLEGYKILTGVANDLPIIEGYGEGDVTLTASTNLVSSIRFFSDLMTTQRDAITYDLEAKLDPGGLQPNIYVSEKGAINLSGKNR